MEGWGKSLYVYTNNYCVTCEKKLKKDYSLSESEKRKKYRKEYKKNNKDKVQKEKSRWKKKQSDNLTDHYVGLRLTHKTSLNRTDLPKELIDLKREQLKLKRIIKKIKDGTE